MLIIRIRTQFLSSQSIVEGEVESSTLFKLFGVSSILDAGEVVGSDRMAGINFSLHTQLYKKCYIDLLSFATVTN